MPAVIDWDRDAARPRIERIGLRHLGGGDDADLALDGRSLAVFGQDGRGSALVDALEYGLTGALPAGAGALHAQVRLVLRAGAQRAEVAPDTHLDALPDVFRAYMAEARSAPFVIRRADATARVDRSDIARFRALTPFLGLDAYDELVEVCGRVRHQADALQRVCARAYADAACEVEAWLGPEPDEDALEAWVRDRRGRDRDLDLHDLDRAALPAYARAKDALATSGAAAERAAILVRHAVAQRDDAVRAALDALAASTGELYAALRPRAAGQVVRIEVDPRGGAALRIGDAAEAEDPRGRLSDAERDDLGLAVSLALCRRAGGSGGLIVLDDLPWSADPPPTEVIARVAAERQLVVTTRSRAWFDRLQGPSFRRAELRERGGRTRLDAVEG